MKSNFDCKNCKERYIGCHSTCEKYLKQKSLLNEKRSVERKSREASNLHVSRGFR